MLRRIWFPSFCVAVGLVMALVVPSTMAQDGEMHETFDNPDLLGWDRSPDVTIADGIARLPPNNILAVPGAWGDFTLRIRLHRVDGEGHLLVHYRASETASNELTVHGSDFVLGRTETGVFNELQAVPTGAPATDWFDLTLQVSGAQHTVWLNDQMLMSFTETATPLPPAGIVLHTQDVTVEIDELVLTVGDEGVSPAEAPAEPPAEQPAPATGIAAYEAGTWERMGGPPGGLGYDIRMQPDNPDIMYVTDAHAGVHKSVDGGLTWFAANTGITADQSSIVPIFCLTIDPHDYNTVWAGTQNGGHIYRSTDAGATWQQRDSGVAFEGRSVRGITIDPNNPNVVYAGLEVASFAWAGEVRSNRQEQVMGEVYKSTDAGATWSLIWQGNNLARYIWVDPRNSNRIYVSTGIFDRDAADSDVRAGVWGGVGILRSDDGGQTWTVLNEANGLGGRYVSSMFMHPDNPDILLAGVSDTAETPGAYVTRDGGDSWERLPLDSHGRGVEAVEIATSNTHIWYAAAEGIIWRSDDAGQTWTEYRIGTPDRDSGFPIDLQVDPRDPYRIFDNNYGGGNFLSEDGGATWVDASQGYTGLKVLGRLGVYPDDAQIVFAEGYRSDDGGLTWTGTMPRSTQGFAFYSLAGGGTGILASSLTGGVWHSDDGGVNWQKSWVVDLMNETAAGRVTSDVQTMRSLAMAPSDLNLVYVGFAQGACNEGVVAACFVISTGLYRSPDGGYSWEAINAPFNGVAILSIAIHPHDTQRVYAGTANGLYESRDGGGSWQLMEALSLDTSALTAADLDNPYANQQYPFVFDVEFDPADPNTIYLATVPGGVWRSTDGGQTWTQAAAGMDPNEPVYELVPDRNRPGVWYASSGMSGVFYTTDGGQMWQRLTDGLTNQNVRGLALSRDGSVLYAGTVGSGVFRLGTP
jgi:photosystem II stability/assembly factor-like uncharacterized protein